MRSANGGDIYLYPGFILYRVAKEAFSVLASHELKIHVTLVEFREDEPVPNDSQTVGQAWLKENKDGSRDRRFGNNHQIPVVIYGRLCLKSASGLWEEFLFSAPESLKSFVEAWRTFESSFAPTPVI
jgi:hypothetical protein